MSIKLGAEFIYPSTPPAVMLNANGEVTGFLYDGKIYEVSPKLVVNPKTFFSDIDDTLVMHDLSSYPKEDRVYVEAKGVDGALYGMEVVPNKKNINLYIKFAKLGYYNIAWSRTGGEWAKAVCTAFGLDPYTRKYLTKPMFYLDDKGSEQWMGERLWRDPVDGKCDSGDDK